ncbi:MAG: WecB/TagA/CpsF family glycosyltransferase [Anaerolineae bacterium]|nr:WecB/TagA/CpsF family glycosyltransferase [Anaerolineae bacterium]
MGVPIHDVDFAATVTWIDRWIAEGGAHTIATVNTEFLMGARKDSTFRAALQRAALCVPDSVGVLWAAKYKGHPLRERVAGSDLVPQLAQVAAQRGWRIFLLGAAPGVAEKAAAILTVRNPGLQVAGCYAGSPSPDEAAEIVARIRASAADIIFVAYGAPKQDLWLDKYLSQTGAAVGIGIGGAFDFIAGVSQRAPVWIQRLGLEWLHRLITQPWRWRRQLALPHFVALVLLGRDDIG